MALLIIRTEIPSNWSRRCARQDNTVSAHARDRSGGRGHVSNGDPPHVFAQAGLPPSPAPPRAKSQSDRRAEQAVLQAPRSGSQPQPRAARAAFPSVPAPSSPRPGPRRAPRPRGTSHPPPASSPSQARRYRARLPGAARPFRVTSDPASLTASGMRSACARATCLDARRTGALWYRGPACRVGSP